MLDKLKKNQVKIEYALNSLEENEKKINFLLGKMNTAEGWIFTLHESAEGLLKRNFDLSNENDKFLDGVVDNFLERLVDKLRIMGNKTLEDANELEMLKNSFKLTEDKGKIKKNFKKNTTIICQMRVIVF